MSPTHKETAGNRGLTLLTNFNFLTWPLSGQQASDSQSEAIIENFVSNTNPWFAVPHERISFGLKLSELGKIILFSEYQLHYNILKA